MIGNKIKSLRNSKNMTQKELADAVGIAQSTIGMIESEKRDVSYEILIKFANFFGVSTDYLLGNESEQFSQISKIKSWSDNLDRIESPEEKIKYIETLVDFAEPKDALKFILSQPAFMAYGGYDLDKLSDEQVLEIANDMLFAMRLSLEKIKNKR